MFWGKVEDEALEHYNGWNSGNWDLPQAYVLTILWVFSTSCTCMSLIHNIFLLPTSLTEERASFEMVSFR